MNRFAFLVALLLVAIAPVAQGAIQLSFDAGAGVVNCTEAGATDTFATCGAPDSSNGVTVSGFTGFGNSPGDAVSANQFGSTVNINNTSGALRTITLWIGAPNYTLPATGGGIPAIQFQSNSGGTGILGESTMDLTSCVDIGNSIPPPPGSFCSTAGSFSLTNNQLTLTGGSDSDTVFDEISPLGGTYSLSQRITLALGVGAQANFSTSIVLTPVPEPTSVALFGSILVATGLALRKRFARN
jgi:hypothetical protein